MTNSESNESCQRRRDRTATTGLPTNGKLGRLLAGIKHRTSAADFAGITKEMAGIAYTADKAETSRLVKGAIARLERSVGRVISLEIMKQCGGECFNRHQLARRLTTESLSVDDIIRILNRGSVSVKRTGPGTITTEYQICLCHIVKRTRTPFPSNTYCHCSVGWWQRLFESALKKPVTVELVQSIISGADSCQFIIRI
jgi:predicted hydrocarbon binding protein